MAYGKKYTCDFDSNVTSYTLEIYQKDYAGSVAALTGGANPVTHTWETDEPKAAIKGSSIAITLINQGNIPLSDFYAVDDEEFKAILKWHTGGGDITLFEGFIVQDDSSELMADYNHEITLSANDNLGLLKDVALNNSEAQPLALVDTISDTVDGQAPNFVQVSSTTYDKVLVGDTFVITSSGGVNGTFTVASKQVITSLYYLIFKEAVTNLPATASTIALYRPDMYTLRTLNSIIKSCLRSTGLELNTREFANINESTQSGADCFLDETLIDPQTFNNNTSWDDCYTVLTKILDRFNCTLFQAKGTWNIVRWDETRYYDYAIPGFIYDSDFAAQQAQALDDSSLIFGGFPKFLIGISEDSKAETGLLRKINRPFKYSKETFNYRQPVEILRNFDLQQLGNLITTYTTGSGTSLQTVREYEVIWWYYTNAAPTPAGVNGPATYFIRVVEDSVGNEIQRYLVVKNNDIHSYPIQAQIGDILTFSFSVKQSDSFSTIALIIKLTDGTNTVYAQQKPSNPGWKTTTGSASVQISPNDWSSVGFETQPIPFDGLLTVYVRTLTATATNENLYRDLRIDYVPLINESTKITGQTHTAEQDTIIKNKGEKEIFIDNSPRNSIAGTLFLNSLTGLLQTRAGQWKRSYASGDKNLGEITTFENLFLRRIPRTLLEGTFYGLLSGGNHLSPLSVCRYTFFTDLNFIFGRLEIDYRNNSAGGTLFEMYKDMEVDSALAYYYTFQFLYASK